MALEIVDTNGEIAMMSRVTCAKCQDLARKVHNGAVVLVRPYSYTDSVTKWASRHELIGQIMIRGGGIVTDDSPDDRIHLEVNVSRYRLSPSGKRISIGIGVDAFAHDFFLLL